jgi:hypothetical protein
MKFGCSIHISNYLKLPHPPSARIALLNFVSLLSLGFFTSNHPICVSLRASFLHTLFFPP